MRGIKTLIIAIAVSMLFAACSSVKLDSAAPVEDRTGKELATAKTDSVTSTAPVTNADSAMSKAGNASDPLNDTGSILAKRSVYFDLDSYTVKDEYKAVVEAHGQYLSQHRDRKIIIQGNTDERGGSEYNLALGQKRAEAVRRALSLLGVPESQMEAISLGKEKPKATGNDEAAWAENRRSDIVY
jgi:peptidoglycan-associated lipoprotein